MLSRNKGLKNREISNALNLSQKTVESHITKALKTIRAAIEKRFPDTLQMVMFFFRIVKSHIVKG